MSLSSYDFEWAAEEIGCDVPAIMTVDAVESVGGGFLPSGEPKVLFEPHVFSRLTNGRFDGETTEINGRTYPLSYSAWRPGEYGPESIQHAKLQAAVNLDRDAALMSCSWGNYQVLGENWRSLGYSSLQDFINHMYGSERDHLDSFVRFVKVNGLAKHLKDRNWSRFARGYNGPSYHVHGYHTRLQETYEDIVEA